MINQNPKTSSACGDLRWRSRRFNLYCGILATAVAALTNGCATSNRLTAEANSINVPVKFVDASGETLPMAVRPSSPSLQLGAIGGATAGWPDKTLQTDPITKQSTVQIGLNSFETAIKQQAKTMTTAAATYLQVVPADTKFARVSTLLTWSGPPSGSLSVAFLDPNDSRNSLGLAFFDRPCRMTGTTTTSKSGEKRTLVVDLTITKPGLIWIIVAPDGTDRSVMSVAPGTVHPLLVIAPPENVKHGSFQVR
jgi:hypothetical protein